MTTTPALAPYPYFTDAVGTALDGGNIYIGTAGLDPRTNPITVYQDAANTITWAQPLRTVSGYPAYQGAPSNFYPTASTYSIVVTTSTGAVVFRDLNVATGDTQLRADLAASTVGKGASLVTLEDGRTVQAVLGLTNGRFYDGAAANLLIRRSNAGATRVHFEPFGYINSGVSTKLDFMFDPYDLDNANYRIFNIYNSTGDLNATGESGITFLGNKNVGNHFGLWSSMHFGFSDDGANACAMKIHYVDYTQPSHYTPAKGGWRTAKAVATGDYVTSLVGGTGRIYVAASTGTTGATVPSHVAGTVSDGAVDWTFVRAVNSANIRPMVMFAGRDQMPKLGFDVGVQHARNELFWNNTKLQFLDQNNTAVAWSIFTNSTTDDLLIQTGDGLGQMRFDATGKFIQLDGLAFAENPENAVDLDTTPSIIGCRGLVFNNSAPTSVTRFDDGVPWQPVFIRSGNGQTTLVHSADLRLVGKVNRVLTANDYLDFRMNSAGTQATEVGYRD